MSPQARLLQGLAVFIPVVLLWLSSFRAQAQAIAKCWVFSPVVDEATIRAEVSKVESLEPGTGRQLWSVSSRVTWDRPTSLDSHGAYAVRVLRMPSFETPKFCSMEEGETLVHTEEFLFTGLDFGFLYEFTVFVVNATNMAKSLVGISKGFGTPDCYQATGDLEFCKTAPVQYAGAPIEPRLDSQCLQANNSLLTAHLSWQPPVQVNGDVTAYKLQYLEPDAPPGTLPKVTTAMPDPASPGGRVNAEIYDMAPNTAYTILISAFVTDPSDHSFNEGLQVELKYRTTGTQASIPVCPSPSPTIPPSPTTPLKIASQTPGQKPASQTPGQKPTSGNTNGQQPTNPAPTTRDPPQKPAADGDANRPTLTPTRPSRPGTTTATTTEKPVQEKPVASSKRAGIAIAACLVALGVIGAVVMLILHLVRSRSARPDTKGAQKGKKTITSPA